MRDLLLAFHEFRSRPWVTTVAVVTLALGVAGATTMFTMLGAMSSVMVPPGVEADRVGRIAWTSLDESGGRSPLAAEEYVRVKAGANAFESISASSDETRTLGPDGPTVSVKRISADFFRTFRFKVSAGREFTPEDERNGGRPVAIVSEALLRRNPELRLNGPLLLGGDEHTIVGVLPDRHWFPTMGGTDVWLPLSLSRDGTPLVSSVTVTARLRSPGDATLARSQVAVITGRLGSETAEGRPRKLTFITLQQDVATRTRFGLIGLLGPSIVVLLIACGNVANLLLARATRREREMAIRAALGAGRARLVRERLAESAWLAAAGGFLGLSLSFLSTKVLRAWIGSIAESRAVAETIRVDGQALLFALLVTAAVPFVFGLVPALAASRPDLAKALHQAPGRRKAHRGPYGGRDLLVVGEIALAVVLVVCAGMFSRFFAEFGRIEWAFDETRVLAVSLDVADSRARAGSGAQFVEDVATALRQIPGVDDVASGGLIDPRPLLGTDPVEFESCAAAPSAATAVALPVDSRYFATLGLPIRRGRAISGEDTAGAPRVGVISMRHATRCWPGQDPVGRRFRIGRGADRAWSTVIGVAADAMTTRALPDMPQPVYVPVMQGAKIPATVLVRVRGDPAAMISPIRAAIRRIGRSEQLGFIGRPGENLRSTLEGASVIMRILGGFGGFALVLAALGVFSVISYMVAERTREFGIRIAVGASRWDILLLVVGQAAVVVAIGACVSIVGTLAVMRVGFRELAVFASTDPLLWAIVVALLAVVAVGASVVPGRRAMRVEPKRALRAE
jgi:putative ABC transport system permease protein